MTLVGSLLSAMSGLRTTQAALQINANNIANVNTEGYTRKTAAQQTPVVGGAAKGVELGDVRRTVDQNLLRQIRAHIARLSGQQVQNDFLSRTQSLFGTPGGNSSISHNLTSLGSAFEAFALAPSSAVARNTAVDTARRLADQLNGMSGQLQSLRAEADRAIAQSVDRINSLLGDLQTLNGRISQGQVTSQDVEDLRDQRDLAIRELSEEIDIQVFERSNGEVVIATGAGRTLLDGQAITLTHTAAAQIAPQSAHPTTIGPIAYGPTSIDITAEIGGGRIGGLIGQRDGTLVDLQGEIDRLAEVLRDELNALHNDGTAFPPPTSLTGTRSLVAADAPSMTGSFRVSVLSADGVVVETLDIDLAALAPPNVGQLVTQINGMTNAAAAFNADGQVTLAATGGNRIAVNELDSQVSSGNRTSGMAQFLGLNDIFDSGSDYDVMVSGRVISDTAALGQAGTLSFAIGGATTNVAYGAGDSLTDIATAISGALGGANITASVIQEAGGFRLELTDADGDNLFLTDSGGLTAQINLRPGQVGTADRIAVRPALLADPGLLAGGELSDAAGLAVGDLALSAGDGDIARALADAFTSDLAFAAAGALPGAVTTLAAYAGNIISLNAADANAIADDVAFGESFQIALDSQFAAVSAVNLDEELAQLIILQNAYAASARVTTTVSELLDELLAIVR